MLECFDRPSQDAYKKGIIESILATDMSLHNTSLKYFQENKQIYAEGKADKEKSSVGLVLLSILEVSSSMEQI